MKWTKGGVEDKNTKVNEKNVRTQAQQMFQKNYASLDTLMRGIASEVH